MCRERITESIKGFIELARPHNILATSLTTLVGFLAALERLTVNLNFNATLILLTVGAVILIAAGGYVINDYFDADIDMINKPYRPIPSGRVSRNHALIYSIILLVAGVLLSALVGLPTLLLASLNASLLIAYSYRVKCVGLVGNLLISYLGAASIIYGALAVATYVNNLGIASASYIPALFAFFLLLGREIVKTVEDVKADKLRNVKSVPILMGVRKGLIISIIPLIVVITLSPLPFIIANYGYIYLALALLTDSLIIWVIYLIIRMVSSNSLDDDAIISYAGRLRAYLKVAIFTGTMAFLLDLLTNLLIT